MSDKTITVNGSLYDKHTGMPIKVAQEQDIEQHTKSNAKHVHSKTQKSKTLNRNYVVNPSKKSESEEAPEVLRSESQPSQESAADNAVSVRVTPVEHKITRFAKSTNTAKNHTQSEKTGRIIDIAPVAHPMVQRVHAAAEERAQQKQRIAKPSEIIKAEAIAEAFDNSPSASQRHRAKAPKSPSKQNRNRRLSLAAACTTILLLGGYFTYVNMPNLSTRVAAARAGIDASYPTYRPAGYSIDGPVAYGSGLVTIKFAANGSDQGYVVEQSKSGWDSSAVLENYVKPRSDEKYTITRDSGLTIFTYEGNAAWVNKGILYTIEGDAPLSDNQIQRIALSM